MTILLIGFGQREIWPEDMMGMHKVIMVSNEEIEAGFLEMLDPEEQWVALLQESEPDSPRMEHYRKWKEIQNHLVIIPIGSESVMAGIGTVPTEDIETANAYWYYGGEENLCNLLQWLIYRYEGGECPASPVEAPADGILDLRTMRIYKSWAEARRAGIVQENFLAIGMLIHRSSWAKSDMNLERLLIEAFTEAGIFVVPVVLEGGNLSRKGSRTLNQLLEDCFYKAGRLKIRGIVNRMIFTSNSEDGKSMYERAAELFSRLKVPVFQPISAYFCTEQAYDNKENPISDEIPWSYLTPELQGMIEPVLISLRDKDGRIKPLTERIQRFVRRVHGHLRLSEIPPQEKRVVLMLHNSPCSGVEATVGIGHELNVMESAANILHTLAEAGYRIHPIPEDGQQLKQWFLERKAYSDFRWTNVEQICHAGGDIYRMELAEYRKYYERLSCKNKEKVEELYGKPPGEGMVLDGKLILTGLNLGNVLVMLEPKRGCYGPKCTGEVCKILQDPYCPPPHQYLASFWYIREHFKADALVRLGTHGAAEFLPGKGHALSKDCWPDIVAGELPVYYIYHSDIPSEALTAKRRSYAVLKSHLPATGCVQEEWHKKMKRLLTEWEEARTTNSGNEELLIGKIYELLEENPDYLKLVRECGQETAGFRLLRQKLQEGGALPGNWHTWGKELSKAEKLSYIKEVWSVDEEIQKLLAQEFGTEKVPEEATDVFLEKILAGKMDLSMNQTLAEDAVWLLEGLKLTAKSEMEGLLAALRGERVKPGIYGGPEDNGREILPTAKNIYTMDSKKVPTQAAYEMGARLAEELLLRYQREEGRFPEQVALNMISQDITRSKGIQVSQFLNLMGIRPVWDKNGDVEGLMLIPLEELKRPRIDVILRISGVLRDSWPQIVALMDDGVLLAASAMEPAEQNFIRKHTMELLEGIEQGDITETKKAFGRIFGDPPGTFGAGVDLALKASAWKDEKDLARYFTEASSYAYGRNLSGERMVREFVFHAGNTDVTWDHTATKRYDVLAAGFSAEVQGGFKLAARYLGGRKVRQYQSTTAIHGKAALQSLEEALRECMEKTMLNPLWKEQMRRLGYQGAAEMMHRLQNVFTWQCVNEAIGDEMVDCLVQEYILDPEMNAFFRKENPFALEETARRFLELHTRNKWNGSKDCLNQLEEQYLNAEGDLEDQLGEAGGEWQGGSVEIIADDQVDSWKQRLGEVDRMFDRGGRT